MADPALPGTETDLSPQDRERLKKVRDFKELSERARRPYVDRWNEYYGLHLNYRRFRDAYNSGTESDRDDVKREMVREWGAELFIPYIFTVIETITPRAVFNDPRMKVKPAHPDLPRTRQEAVKQLFENRQSEINYTLKLLPTAKRGFKYGIGVQKSFWDRCYRNRVSIERGIFGRRIQKYGPVLIDEGPMVEDVDIFDFFWAPYAKDMQTCDQAIHRTWRPMSYVRRKVEAQEWNPIDLERVAGLGSESDRGDGWAERMAAAGLSGFDTRQGRLHEVWEYHDGEQVITILDKQLVVQAKPNPYYHRELPFQIFRPTIQEGEFVGIGEIQPIAHLQYELNTMRSQRRDNATLVLQKAFIYAEGMVDPADLIIGPGKGIPVYGNPGEVIQPLNFGEIPASGYEEEDRLKSDIERASGLSDAATGAAATSDTATGEQIVMAAANVRVAMKSKMLSLETVKQNAAQWLDLYSQNVPQAGYQVPVDQGDGYDFATVTAEDLAGIREVLPDVGSMEPENTPQKRNDAMAFFNQLNGNTNIDQRWLCEYILKAFDIADVQAALAKQQEVMNPQVAQVVGEAIKNALQEHGLDNEQAGEIALEVMQEAIQTAGVSSPDEAPFPSSNGASAQPVAG